jgi:streptogramin lyase
MNYSPGLNTLLCYMRLYDFRFLFTIITFLFFISLHGQAIIYDFPSATENLRVTIDESQCSHCEPVTLDYYDCSLGYGMSYDPAGNLFGLNFIGSSGIYQVDPIAATCTPVFIGSLPNGADPTGLLAVGGGIYYTMGSSSDVLYRWDANAGTVDVVGSTGFKNYQSDICISNGQGILFDKTDE